jgi:hypothetical protein
MDDLLAGTLISSFVEFQCRLLSSAVAGSRCSSVENIPFQAERHSGEQHKLFGFTTEWYSASDRNRVHLRRDSPTEAAAQETRGRKSILRPA